MILNLFMYCLLYPGGYCGTGDRGHVLHHVEDGTQRRILCGKGFFHSFKQNLKQGIVIQIIMLLLGIVLAFDLYFCRMMSIGRAVYRVFSYIFVVALFVYAMLFFMDLPGTCKVLQHYQKSVSAIPF